MSLPGGWETPINQRKPTLHGQLGGDALARTDHVLRHTLVPALVRGPNVADQQVPAVDDPHAGQLLVRPEVVQIEHDFVLAPADGRFRVSLGRATLEQGGFAGRHPGVLGFHPEFVAKNWKENMKRGEMGQSLYCL